MLQKKYRLKKYSAFIATYRLNNAVSDENVCIYFGKEKTKSDLDTKFGFVVSKKIHKRAVVRNRIKRLMRENVRLLLKENKINNVTNEYLYLVINERMQNHKKTVITTNLDFRQIQEVYGERIFSRLMHKKQSLKINFPGNDLRIKSTSI